MKFIDVAKKLKLIIDELAFDRSYAMGELRSLCYTFSVHICKTIAWEEDGNNRKVWMDELYEYIKRIGTIKLKGQKSLKQKDYLDYFFNPYLENEAEFMSFFNNVIQDCIIRDGYSKPFSKNMHQAYVNYRALVKELLQVIPSSFIDYAEVTKLLDKYLRG